MKLVVAAMQEEANKIEYKDVLITGVGKVNAASKLTEALVKNDVKAIFNVGFVGASYHYNIGDIIIIEDARYHDFDLSMFGYQKGEVPHFPAVFKSDDTLYNKALKRLSKAKTGHLYTGDYFMTESVDVPYIVDMEGASLYQVAYMNDIPIIAIKVVSDIIGMTDHIKNYQMFETSLGALKISEVIDLLIKED